MTLNSGAYFILNTTSVNPFTLSGGSSLVINDGTFVANTQFLTTGASSLEVFSGSLVINNQTGSGFGINNGATVTIHPGGLVESSNFFNSQNQDFTVGGTFFLDGGTLLSSGAGFDPLRASNGLDGVGFDFTGLGGTIQIDNFTDGSLTDYLDGKATAGFFKIDGTTVSGFGEANGLGGQWLELVDNGGSGSLFLVPEPSAALLGGLGILILFRRRRS